MTDFRQRGLDAFLRAVTLVREKVESFERYPFSIPAIRALESFDLHPKVTFFVGENGSGKSTLIEAIAVAARFNAEGGQPELQLCNPPLRVGAAHRSSPRARRPKTGYFLGSDGLTKVAYEDTEHYALTRDFLQNRERYLRRLFGKGEG